MFAALAEDFGSLNSKVNFFVAIAPATKLGSEENSNNLISKI